MNRKSMAVLAVLAMFLASSVCVFAVAEDNEGQTDASASPLTFTEGSYPTEDELEPYGAIYDENTTTLTFNENKNVTVTKVDEGKPYIIKASLDSFTIVVNANVTLTFNASFGTKEAGVDASAIINEKSGGLLTFRGDGTLKLIPPYSMNQGHTCNCIKGSYITINCNITIDGSHVSTGHFRGVNGQNGIITVTSAKLEITGCNRYDFNSIYANQGLYSNWNITIRNSTVKITGVISGIWQEDDIYKHTAVGSCTISNKSTVNITTIDVEGNLQRSMPINTASLTILDSTVNATTGNAKNGDDEKSPANAVAVNAFAFNAINSKMTFIAKDGASSSGLEFGSTAIIKDCDLTCICNGGYGKYEIVLAQSAIKTNYGGVLTANNSTITSKILNNNADHTYGIIGNCKFTKTTVVTDGQKAFHNSFLVLFDTDSTAQLQGSNDGKNFKDISADDVYNYKYIRSVMGNKLTFELNEGCGSEVAPMLNLKAGDKVVLPKCDATKDGLVFAGWNDGKNIYQPGDEYTVTDDVTFYAIYEKKSVDNTGAIVGAIGVIAVIAIVGGITIFNRKPKKDEEQPSE